MLMELWVGTVVTVALFLISHILLTVWWASKVNTLLQVIQENLRDVVVELKAFKGTYVTKDEIVYQRTLSEREHAALWKRVEALTTS